MAQPTRSDVHVNKPLTNVSIAYIQSAKDFIADKLFPIVSVLKQSDRYFMYNKDDWFRSSAQKRAPGTESAGTGYTIDNTPSYFCDKYAVHKDIDDDTRANADMPLDMDRDATLFVTQQLLLRREITFAAKYFASSLWTGAADFTPSPKWDTSTGDPLKDIDVKKRDVKKQTGFLPNALAVADDVFFAIRNNAAILDRIKYTQRGIISEDLLALAFGVEKFLVAAAVQNSAAENQTASMDFLISKKALLVYANPAPSLLQPSGGYTFAWSGLFGAGAQGGRVKRFRMEQIESDRVEGEMAYDQKVVATDLGVLCTAVIS